MTKERFEISTGRNPMEIEMTQRDNGRWEVSKNQVDGYYVTNTPSDGYQVIWRGEVCHFFNGRLKRAVSQL